MIAARLRGQKSTSQRPQRLAGLIIARLMPSTAVSLTTNVKDAQDWEWIVQSSIMPLSNADHASDSTTTRAE